MSYNGSLNNRQLPVASEHTANAALKTDNTVQNNSQPAQLTTLTKDEHLIVSQCEVCIPEAIATTLTPCSALSAWIDAWQSAGLLRETLAATIPDLDELKAMLSSHLLDIASLPIRSWPVWALQCQLETERRRLNITGATRNTYSPIAQERNICMRKGIDAPFLYWVRVWREMGVINAIMASSGGVGICSIPERRINSSASDHANKSTQGHPNGHERRRDRKPSNGTQIKISLFTKNILRANRHAYILSSHYGKDGRASAYVYHSLTKAQIPSIDAISWLARHHLQIAKANDNGTSPIQLIESVIGPAEEWPDNLHAMGMALQKNVPTKSGSIIDSNITVADVIECGSASELFASAPASYWRSRMAGVYPATWIVNFGKAGIDNQSGNKLHGAYLCRKTTLAGDIYNAWLSDVAQRCGLPMFNRSIHSAKANTQTPPTWQGHHFALASSNGFADSFIKHNESKTLSTYRLPLASLMSAIFTMRSHGAGKTASIDAFSGTKSLLLALNNLLCNPHNSVIDFLRWAIFDSLAGTLAQIPYRYQITLSYAGYSLTPIPFWSLEGSSRFQDQTSEHFGFKLLIDDAGSLALLATPVLSLIAKHADVNPDWLIEQRDKQLKHFKALTPEHLKRLDAINTNALPSPDIDALHAAQSKMRRVLNLGDLS